MKKLFEILDSDDDNQVCDAMVGYYNDIYHYLVKNKSILTTIFNIPDIVVVRDSDNWEDLVRSDVAEQLEINIEDVMQDQISGEVQINLKFQLETKDITALNQLLLNEGLTLIRGLDILKNILKEKYKIGSKVRLSVHIDNLIDIDTRQPTDYFLLISFYKV